MLKAKKLNFIARSVSLNQQLRPHTGRYLSAKVKSWPSLGRDKNFIPIQHAFNGLLMRERILLNY